MEQPPLVNASLYRPYSKLVEITIRGKKFAVPENNILLRCFQFLAPDTIPYGRYCWNEECQYCRVSVSRARGQRIQQALSCKLMVEQGMTIHELSGELMWNLRNLLRSELKSQDPSPKSQTNSKL